MNAKRRMTAAAGAVLMLGLAAAFAAAQAPSFLKGPIKTTGTPSVTLTVRMDDARTQAKGANYFTAHMFESRNKIHSHGDGRIIETYDVKTQGAKIHIRSKSNKDENGISTDDRDKNPSPAGLLLLWDGSKSNALLDATILDPEQTYEFEGSPVFWLGTASNEESMGLLESVFPKVEGEHLKTTLLFLASCHTGPRGYAFLKKTALGSEAVKARESAVFWMGQSGNPRVLADIKEILSQEKSAALRKSVSALKDIVEAKDDASGLKDQAVFAISQLPKDKSVPMLIDIAKTNGSPSVRKKAIFWLGQTGDEAALKFFEDILLKK